MNPENQNKRKCYFVVIYMDLVLCPASRALHNGIRAMVPNLEPEGSQLICGMNIYIYIYIYWRKYLYRNCWLITRRNTHERERSIDPNRSLHQINHTKNLSLQEKEISIRRTSAYRTWYVFYKANHNIWDITSKRNGFWKSQRKPAISMEFNTTTYKLKEIKINLQTNFTHI